ncbi:unnamed protein product [Darwinula stevensoni]|uniref:GP-PDE domain-containing protein n=1 Tax=Darwinula stevensoni TaxID=69355 RepID=A0A7R8X4Q8_9CRUS|nr:unnamed protein product [Darwinula stevensoni]CAG0879264.1 unnamed protein product [Darwinula stevensoni]
MTFTRLEFGRAIYAVSVFPVVVMVCVMILVAVVSTYIVASAFFTRFPQLSPVNLLVPNSIVKKRKFAAPIRHISHRGGAAEAMENTMDAFKYAAGLGTQMLELDVHLTKDGKVVVLHDLNLLRVAGVDRDVTQTDYDELPALLKKVPVHFAPGTTFETSRNLRIPLLEDVFKAFPTLPINIDPKDENPLLVKAVGELIEKYERAHLTVWGSPNDTIARWCHETNPEVGLLFSMRRVVVVCFLFYLGLLPYVPLKETHLEVPLLSIFLGEDFQEAWGKHAGRQLLVRAANLFLFRRSLYRHLDRRGIPTYLWVLNREKDWKEAFDNGIEGVMTDRPASLMRFLENNRLV